MTELAEATSPQTSGATLVIVPVGSIEQHGPHLPLETDTLIARAVADRMALELGDAWVAPAVSYGSSGEHQAFPGTCSIGTEALRLLVVELVRSIRCWADRVVLVNAHGGNLTAVHEAVEQLRAEGHDVTWVPCATEDVDLHAGHTETSLMLHLAPWSVRRHRAEAGNTRPLDEILPAMRTGGVAAVSANGVLGDPTGASAHHGARILEQIVGNALRALREERVAR
ncbi:mycofactocin biosynthesis peptidyl-dipeptidase MftE [Nocardioides sp. cx-173]|uniref:mycofactocin biosynthesis peptidyl-dipeptidase MftE n=1 Tax=Nocardioides sp. cx-173 TaxID=2898796 RepID=UPI001E43C9A6|nr:mycofactocin biosynthesis peptidyl-dipeptidase MftE [Nocardioides sp. cx-173]MCD4523584.1 mycofactocin biosynthesis peptidyl-dipeptidase MftE [Nocardioides sp. cx-173]UGB42080.1 mycofactocin biosynthesis peptidyl-dipeptidase MftE [Nocardioides sp. cx-173]